MTRRADGTTLIDRLDQIRAELSDLASDEPEEVRELLAEARSAIAMAQDVWETINDA